MHECLPLPVSAVDRAMAAAAAVAATTTMPNCNGQWQVATATGERVGNCDNETTAFLAAHAQGERE